MALCNCELGLLSMDSPIDRIAGDCLGRHQYPNGCLQDRSYPNIHQDCTIYRAGCLPDFRAIPKAHRESANRETVQIVSEVGRREAHY